MRTPRYLAVCALVAAGACGDGSTPKHDGGRLSLLVFTRENLWTHPSNPVAQDAIRTLATADDWALTITNDQNAITPEALATTDVVMFSLTSGPVLDDPQRAALEDFFRAGGGFVGTHSASATEPDWAFYHQLVPVTFKTHPSPMNLVDAKLDLLNDDPLLLGLPNPWMRTDEYYTFWERPEDNPALHLLLALDESSSADYPDGDKVGFHPLAFTREDLGNRVFYTALGHTPESYAEPGFMGILERAILWAAEPRRGR